MVHCRALYRFEPGALHNVLDATSSLLLMTAIVTAVFHTLIPDHWLPFVLIGRARDWSARTTALVAGFSALVHVALSLVLGWIALGIGQEAARSLGQRAESASALMLVIFGLLYAGWSWRKGGHFHPGGHRVHAAEEAAACQGEEGDAHPEHLHYHADGGLIRDSGGRGALSLALIVGANPCVLVFPLLLKAAEHGSALAILVMTAYALATLLAMVLLSVLGVVGSRRVRLPGAARHMESLSGLIIAALGAAFLLLE